MNYELDLKYLYSGNSSTSGTQTKYYRDGYWYKVDRVGNEGLTEELCSLVLSCSNDSNFVKYRRCEINDRKGCRCKTYLKKDEESHSLSHIYKVVSGKELINELYTIGDVSGRVNYVCEIIEKYCNIDILKYLKTILLFDMLVLNEDRHFNNIELIRGNSGCWRVSPIFDNGQSLLTNVTKHSYLNSIEHNIDKATSATFSGSFEQQVYSLNIGDNILRIDYNRLYNELDKYVGSREKSVLLKQLNRYGFMFNV